MPDSHVGGRIKFVVSGWQEITSQRWVRTVSEGVLLDFVSIPTQYLQGRQQL